MDTLTMPRGAVYPQERVDVVLLPDAVALLDSKLNGHGALWFSPEVWAQFLRDAKNGKYDPPDTPDTPST